MLDDPPASLESRMLLESLKLERSYPFLRALRWLLLAVAGLHGVLGLVATLAVIGEEVDKEWRSLIDAVGGPATGSGLLAGVLILLAVSLRVVVLVAVAEGIKLLLDVRQAQKDLAAKLG